VPFLRRPDGCRIHYEVAGDPDAPPLLILEGVADRVAGWRRSVPTLAAELYVAVVDHRGNGESDEPPGPCTMATFVDDAIAVLDGLGWERANLYGQSFGGMVAQELALTHPERVRTLVLGCTDAGERHTIAVEDPNVPKGEPWRSWYARGYPDEHPDEVAEDLRVSGAEPQHPEGARRQWEAMAEWDAYDRLPDISVPTLVLHGTDDRLIAPANAEVLAARIPRAELVWMEGAGHVYNWEQPERSDGEVLAFLRRNTDA
jgi:pimeloyl-ACP methyl ester carboxylesterase